MKYRKLGRTGIEVSEIGFGAWGIGGNSYGPVDDSVSTAALRAAFDLGVTFFDTSDLYGDGHSEEVLGTALKDVRGKVIIATKVGTLPHTGFYMPQDFSPGHIVSGVEESLRRLKTDTVDLLQLHSPPLDVLEGDGRIVETLQGLVRAGKIRAYGISARSPADGRAAVEKYGFPVVQVNFNLIDQRAAECGLFALAAERGTGVICRTPLCFGYLSGKLQGDEEFPGLDHRKNWPPGQRRRWAEAPDLFSFLNDGKERTAAQLALRFCLDHPEISAVIPGMLTPEEVREDAVTASMVPLSADEMERIRFIYQRNVFYDPSAKQGSRP
jgi:aryl-alcohol dehydrogenase-like predicted oxidoreductase